jgi:hypothetical protein
VIRSRLNSLGQKFGYSTKLISFIQACLERDEFSRTGVDKLHEDLKEHSESFIIGFGSPGKSDLRRSTIDNCELYSQVGRTNRGSHMTSMIAPNESPRMSFQTDYDFSD